ncbi:hypothetical protein AVEN_170245-1 [Araneus ventricosus]|uniref:Uncharacterized protein n=1 Tax=Araneus ventricosus TaxID=182803 RepID=A0A4Y2N390_ARAVE|nr:hypothetical protein AVEN_170245-1 [Araneus ventricosus]
MRKVYFTCIKNFKHVSLIDFQKRYIEVTELGLTDLRVPTLLIPETQPNSHYRSRSSPTPPVGSTSNQGVIKRLYNHWVESTLLGYGMEYDKSFLSGAREANFLLSLPVVEKKHRNETRAEHPLHNIGDRLAGILGANRLSCDRRTIPKKSSNFSRETEQTGRLLTEFHFVDALRKPSATCWTVLQKHESCHF